MGFIVWPDKDGKLVVLGDENQYRKSERLPHYNASGRFVSEEELKQRDKDGE